MRVVPQLLVFPCFPCLQLLGGSRAEPPAPPRARARPPVTGSGGEAGQGPGSAPAVQQRPLLVTLPLPTSSALWSRRCFGDPPTCLGSSGSSPPGRMWRWGAPTLVPTRAMGVPMAVSRGQPLLSPRPCLPPSPSAWAGHAALFRWGCPGTSPMAAPRWKPPCWARGSAALLCVLHSAAPSPFPALRRGCPSGSPPPSRVCPADFPAYFFPCLPSPNLLLTRGRERKEGGLSVT